jgi:hypothetical protein
MVNRMTSMIITKVSTANMRSRLLETTISRQNNRIPKMKMKTIRDVVMAVEQGNATP